MPPKIKISINLAGAAPAAVAPAPMASIPIEAAVEAVTSMKRDRDDERHDEGPAPMSLKRFKQESVPAITVKDEPVAEDDMYQPLVDAAQFSVTERKWERPWVSEAEELLDFMDLQDNLNFFRVPSAPGQCSVSLVRAQLGDGIYDSFDDFLDSLRLVYRSADKYIGTDVYKQSLKLLESLDTKLKSLSGPVAGVKEERAHEQLSFADSGDDAGPAIESDDDAPIDVKFISKEDLMDDVRYTKETAASDDDDDDEQRRVLLRSSFQDKYENHPDHAHRPFWVCLMVCLCHNRFDYILVARIEFFFCPIWRDFFNLLHDIHRFRFARNTTGRRTNEQKWKRTFSSSSIKFRAKRKLEKLRTLSYP
jgi:hypothetical protein